jgi:hypothetical protein
MTTFGVAAQTIQQHMWHTQQQEQRTHYARSKPSTAAHTAQRYTLYISAKKMEILIPHSKKQYNTTSAYGGLKFYANERRSLGVSVCQPLTLTTKQNSAQ